MKLTRRAALAAAAASVCLPPASSAAAARDADDLTAALDTDLHQHSEFGVKMSGGTGDLRTADWIAARLRASGFAVEQPRFSAPSFTTTRSSLAVAGDSVDVIPQPLVVPTGPEGITAPIAVVREVEDAADAQGCIALIVLPFGRWAAIWSAPISALLKAAAQAGAKAAIVVTTGPSGEAVLLNTPAATPLVALPVAILAPKNAHRFLAAARTRTPATLILDGTNDRRMTCNVIGRLERGPRWLALSTPRTGWFACVGERGTGTAAFLALAAWLAQRFPDLSIFALNGGAHEYDFDGMHRAMDAAPPARDTALWVHIGAALATLDYAEIGGQLTPLPSADSNRILMGSENVLPTLARAFVGLTGLESPRKVIARAGELSGIMQRGYGSAFAVLGVHRWFHTREDTLDKVDARLLTPVVQAHQQAISQILAP